MRISNEPLFAKLFGSELKRKIWTFLSSEPESMSEREMARLFGVSHTAVNKAMRELGELDLVRSSSVGGATVWKLNGRSFMYVQIMTALPLISATTLDLLKTVVREEFHKAKLPEIKTAYIIGSVAEGMARTDSDIDILVIINSTKKKRMNGEELQKISGNLQKGFGNACSLHVYNDKEIERNDPPWLKKAILKGIRVYG